MLVAPAYILGIEDACVAAAPQKPLVDLVVPLWVVRPRVYVLHPAIRGRYSDVVMYSRGAGAEFRKHSLLWSWAPVVGEKLAMVVEMIRIEAWVHG